MAKKKIKDLNEKEIKELEFSTFLSTVTKKFNAIVVPEKDNIERISTGSLLIDNITDKGGFPKGRISEVYGPQSGGKSSLCLSSVAEVQNNGGRALWIDAEHAFDFSFAKKLGVDTSESKLTVVETNSGEEAFGLIDAANKSKYFDIIIIDSVTALNPTVFTDVDFTELNKIGAHALMMSNSIRKLNSDTINSNLAIVFINQIRNKISVYGGGEQTTGGRALPFYASLRIRMKQTEPIIKNNIPIGIKITAVCKKNKVGRPFMSTNVNFMFENGFDKDYELATLLIQNGILTMSGAWVKDKEGNTIAQGLNNFAEMLKENKEYKEKMKKKLNI